MVTVEEGTLEGGFGSACLEAANAAGLDARNIVRLGLPDRFIEHAERGELLADLGLDVQRHLRDGAEGAGAGGGEGERGGGGAVERVRMGKPARNRNGTWKEPKALRRLRATVTDEMKLDEFHKIFDREPSCQAELDLFIEGLMREMYNEAVRSGLFSCQTTKLNRWIRSNRPTTVLGAMLSRIVSVSEYHAASPRKHESPRRYHAFAVVLLVISTPTRSAKAWHPA